MPFNPSLEDLPIRDIKQQDRERLTFGVEFEFSLAVFSEDQQDPSPEDRRPLFGIVRKDAKNFTEREESVIRHVAKTLTDAGISSLSNRDASRSGNELKVWIVKTDVSVRGPGGDKEFDWYSIEVTTPPYYFSSDAVDTVKRVCEVLTNNYRIVCNESAGVHVHVGSAKEMFSLDTLVNLYATLWTFEPQIQEIHPSHRTSGNEYCESLRTMSGVANQIPSGSSHAARGLAKILGVKTADDLGEMVIGDSVIMAYNIVWAIMAHRHRGSIEVDTKNTIEFRQHESTLDPNRAANWARLCVGLLELSDTVQRDVLEKFLHAHINVTSADFTIGQALTALGMPHLAEFFGDKVAEQRMMERESRGESQSS